MADTIKVNLEENSKYRVAYDLMNQIVSTEIGSTEPNREYYLRLYRQCYDAVNAHKPIDEVVAGKKTSNSMAFRF